MQSAAAGVYLLMSLAIDDHTHTEKPDCTLGQYIKQSTNSASVAAAASMSSTEDIAFVNLMQRTQDKNN